MTAQQDTHGGLDPKALEAAAKELAACFDRDLGFEDGRSWSIPNSKGVPDPKSFLADSAAVIRAYLAALTGTVQPVAVGVRGLDALQDTGKEKAG